MVRPKLPALPKLPGLEITLPAADPILVSAKKDFEARYLAWGRGTRPEFIVWEFLTIRKRQVEGRDFLFQSSRYGGRRVFGGVVIDFWLVAKNMVWRVQGERFHLLFVEDRMSDRIDRMRLEQEGYRVVDLWVDDLLTRPDFVLDKAWGGQEVLSPTKDL